MLVDYQVFCITITRGSNGVWTSDLGIEGQVVQGRYPAEIVQALLELGGEFLTANYAAGLKVFEGHQEQHIVWLRLPKTGRPVAMLN